MAIDGDISIANLVTQALKNAGRVAPSAAQITDATAYQFRRVKADIASKSGRHEALVTQYVANAYAGIQRYAWPTDAHFIKDVVLLSAPDEWTGIGQASANGQITLAASFNQEAETVKGKYVVITSGTGANQIRQISGYDNSTKIATVDSNWTTNPSGFTYFIATDHTKIWSEDKATEWSMIRTPGSLGKSYWGAMNGRELWLERTPDRLYVLWWNYWAHMDLLDNAGTVILKHIRMHYSLWSQGITAWLCQRYDEDRYQAELQVYDNLLAAYAAEASHVSPTQFYDV